MEKAFVKGLIALLNKHNVRYVVTGGFTLLYYGFPRASMDIDVIVEKDKNKILRFVRKLRQKGFSVSDSDVIYALDKCEHFCVFYKNKFPYFDFKIACDDDSLLALSSPKFVNYHGVRCSIVSPETLIVKKLEWQDVKDVRSILFRYKGKIDMTKLLALAKSRGVEKELQRLLMGFDNE